MIDLHKFQEFTSSHGFDVHDLIIDGEIHRFDAKSQLSGWYIAWSHRSLSQEEHFVCVIGDWVTGEKHTFHSREKRLSKTEKQDFTAMIRLASEKALAEKKSRQEQAGLAAREAWQEAKPCERHPYLTRKKIEPCGSRVNEHGTLLVPCRDINGMILGIQFISEDGTKKFLKGQRVSGTFFLIGAVRERTTAYLCEGFATGVSIHMATKMAVFCSFSAGNLSQVAKEIKTKYPDLNVIICGDDDIFKGTDNVGRKEAEQTAKAMYHEAIFPKFTSLGTKPTDFNDLHCLEGLEAVKEQLTLSHSKIKKGFQPLGFNGSVHYFFLKRNNSVLKCSSLTPERIQMLYPSYEYLLEMYPHKKTDVDWFRIRGELIQKSIEVGSFNPSCIRGLGTWHDDDRIIVNTGETTFVDNEEKDLNEFKSRYKYTSTERSFPFSDKPLDVTETKKMIEALSLFNWEHPSNAILVAGWIAQARLSGALPTRPHIWISGSKGSGKSTLINKLIMPCLGSSSGYFQAQGGTTAAGIRQAIQSDSIPVIYDEFEILENNQEQHRIMNLLRQSWSFTDAKIFKGTADGVAHAYSTNFSALVGSIRVHFQNDADRSRFTVCELKAHQSDNNHKKHMDALMKNLNRKYGDRLFSRSVRLFRIIKNSSKIFQEILAAKHNQRFGEQVGSLLGGYWSLVSEVVVNETEAGEVIAKLNLENESNESREKDEEQCLQKLLTSKVRLNSGYEKTIGSIVINGEENDHKHIEHFGLKVTSKELVIASNHSELVKIFAGTRWKSWNQSLKRFDNSTFRTHRIAGAPMTCLLIPLSLVKQEVRVIRASELERESMPDNVRWELTKELTSNPDTILIKDHETYRTLTRKQYSEQYG
jgi:putative DNA primase/helicase